MSLLTTVAAADSSCQRCMHKCYLRLALLCLRAMAKHNNLRHDTQQMHHIVYLLLKLFVILVFECYHIANRRVLTAAAAAFAAAAAAAPGARRCRRL